MNDPRLKDMGYHASLIAHLLQISESALTINQIRQWINEPRFVDVTLGSVLNQMADKGIVARRDGLWRYIPQEGSRVKEQYEPQVGDRVRVTYETVVNAIEKKGKRVRVKHPEYEGSAAVPRGAVTLIERPIPPLPTKRNAIVRINGIDYWRRSADGTYPWTTASTQGTFSSPHLHDQAKRSGSLTVIFEGVDE